MTPVPVVPVALFNPVSSVSLHATVNGAPETWVQSAAAVYRAVATPATSIVNAALAELNWHVPGIAAVAVIAAVMAGQVVAAVVS